MTLERTLNRNLLKYAVQRQMFNSDGSVADVRRSVLVEVFVPSGDAGAADKHGFTLYDEQIHSHANRECPCVV